MLSHADGLILVETFKSGNSLVNISAFRLCRGGDVFALASVCVYVVLPQWLCSIVYIAHLIVRVVCVFQFGFRLMCSCTSCSSPQCSTCEDEGHYALYCAIGLWRLDSYMWEVSGSPAATPLRSRAIYTLDIHG